MELSNRLPMAYAVSSRKGTGGKAPLPPSCRRSQCFFPLPSSTQSQIAPTTFPRMDNRFSSQVDSIVKHAAPRAQARRWARNLRFLTFDDDDDNGTGTGAVPWFPVTGQCQRCAERVPVPAGHICASHVKVFDTLEEQQDRERKLGEYGNPCVHVEELTCEKCRDIPLFPNAGKVSTFRIRRIPISISDGRSRRCNHFVAVSYCWADQDLGDKLPPYTVIEEDGTKRPMRAPRATIDRVVRFARENGFRMIWIDQECIDQDNTQEKELAIQCMDLVYQRAHTCIGLMSTRWEQRHLDALLLSSEFDYSGRFKGTNFPHRRGSPAVWLNNSFATDKTGCYDSMMGAVFSMLRDPWNTRAWIFQEAFVASNRLLLLFPIVGTVNTEGWWHICHEKSLSELAIRIISMQEIIEDHIAPMFDAEMRKSRAYDDIRFFYPPAVGLESTTLLVFSEFQNRRRCDAATAWAHLDQRGLLRDIDRVAILANLCGYEQRLNTVELEKGGYDVFHCFLALAVINGDLSLLPPEMYKVPETHPIVFPSGTNSDFTWVHSLTGDPRLIDSTTSIPASSTMIADDPRQYGLSSSGLTLLGTLWKVKKFIKLESIKETYSERWHEAKQAEDAIDMTHKAVTHILFEMIMQLRFKGEIQVADAIFNSTSSLWLRPEDLPMAAAEKKEGFLNRLFSGKRTPVKGPASHTTPTSSESSSDDTFRVNTTVESVLQMPPDMKTEHPEDLFDGLTHQVWIVERVMESGGLWVAEPINAARIRYGRQRVRNKTFRSDKSGKDSSVSLSERWSEAVQNAQSDQRALLRFFQESGPDFCQQSHATRLVLTSLFANYLDSLNDIMLDSTLDAGPAEKDTGADAAGSKGDRIDKRLRLTSVMQTWGSRLIGQMDASEFMDRRAVFDVGGDTAKGTLVLTPFQAQLESLPRIRTRSLSVSWIVEEVELDNDAGARTDVSKTFRTKGMVKGMWRYTFLHSGRFTLV